MFLTSLVEWMDMAEKRISKLKNTSIHTSKTERQREQRLKEMNKILKNRGTPMEV